MRLIRIAFAMIIIWAFVLRETGPWTCIALTWISISIEVTDRAAMAGIGLSSAIYDILEFNDLKDKIK